jgi:hypothetical protein
MWRERRSGWFLVDILLFGLLNIFFLYLTFPFERLDRLLSPHVIFFLSLATYRISEIVANEVVTRPIRAPFVNKKIEDGEEVEEPKRTGLLGNIGSLIYCPSCVGVWVGMLLVYSYLLFPEVILVVAVIFTLSALERVLSNILKMFD